MTAATPISFVYTVRDGLTLGLIDRGSPPVEGPAVERDGLEQAVDCKGPR